MNWKNDYKDYATYKYLTGNDDYNDNDDDGCASGCLGCLTFIVILAFAILVFTV